MRAFSAALAAATVACAGAPPVPDDRMPPRAQVVTPADGARITTRTPTIEIEYADESGVADGSLEVRINGRDYSAEFDHYSHGASGRIPPTRPLPLGENRLEATLTDRAGNVARVEAAFVNAAGGWLLARAAPGAEPRRSVDLVLDASGSMRELIGVETRMDAAKAAVRSLVESMPPRAELGLRVFYDCDTVEPVVPIAPLDRSAFIARVDEIRPSGGTPIVESLLASFDALSRVDEGQRVAVLVTDGGESCGGDMDHAVNRARDAATRVIVIGFDIDDAGITDELRALAEATGGAFYDAREPDELRAALRRSVLRLGYVVLAADGQQVAAGELEGEPLELEPGEYTVRFATVPALAVPDVYIEPLAETTLELRRTPAGLEAEVRGPAAPAPRPRDPRPRR